MTNLKHCIQIYNLKEDFPTCRVALERAKFVIERSKKNFGCICFIHGYGSTGKGGIIRHKVREWLNAQKRKGVIKNFICGQDMNIFNLEAIVLKNKYSELEAYMGKNNDGITIVEL